MNERIVELETKMAFQEQAFAELSDALVRQQKQIESLETSLRALRAQVVALAVSPVAHSSEETPPPHY